VRRRLATTFPATLLTTLLVTLVTGTLLGGLLTACSPSDADPADGLTLSNCGREVTVEEPPQRIVSLNQGSTEILLSLGLADRMVGTATWTDPVLPSLADDNAKVERLADNYAAFEEVIARDPDLVTASFGSTLGAGGTASRDQFERVGIPTYLAPSDCVGRVDAPGDGARSEPFEIGLVYREIRELARLTGVEERGEQLVADLQHRLEAAADVDAVGPDGEPVSALFWFANDGSPYVAGCCGAPGFIARTLGLENVLDDTHQEWPQVGWETVVARDPDVIVLGDLTRRSQTAETAAEKIEFLETHPATRQLTAVREHRYIIVAGAELNPSLRTVYGVGTVADGLRELGLAR